MDIDKIIKDIAEYLGKRKGDVKRVYNKIEKDKTEEGLDKILGKVQFERFILLGLGKHYEIDKDKLEELITDDKIDENVEDIEVDENEEDVGFDLAEDNGGFIETDDIDYGKDDVDSSKNWKDLFATVTKKESDGESGFTKVPSLQLLLNIGMKMKLSDSSDEPYIHDGIGKDNKPYTSYAMNIKLLEVLTDDDEILEEVYAKGDFRGEKLYTKNRTYKLWLNERGFETFVAFWRDTLGLNQPDDRIFILKKSQKKSKKTGRTYNVFKFYEPR